MRLRGVFQSLVAAVEGSTRRRSNFPPMAVLNGGGMDASPPDLIRSCLLPVGRHPLHMCVRAACEGSQISPRISFRGRGRIVVTAGSVEALCRGGGPGARGRGYPRIGCFRRQGETVRGRPRHSPRGGKRDFREILEPHKGSCGRLAVVEKPYF